MSNAETPPSGSGVEQVHVSGEKLEKLTARIDGWSITNVAKRLIGGSIIRYAVEFGDESADRVLSAIEEDAELNNGEDYPVKVNINLASSLRRFLKNKNIQGEVRDMVDGWSLALMSIKTEEDKAHNSSSFSYKLRKDSEEEIIKPL